MISAPQVVIIIVVWNNYPDTQDCLNSLMNLNYPNYRIVVVDNGSTDHSGVTVKENYKNVVVIRNTENLGYSGGCNAGIDYACRELNADYCLVLNNDTVVDDADFIQSLVKSTEGQEPIGIVAPLVNEFTFPHVIQAAGSRVNLFTGRARLLTKVGKPPIWSDSVHGCAFLVKRKVVDDIGGLDDQFYLYWEETDYCLRVRKAGYRVLINPGTRILHKSGKTIGGRGSLYTYYIFRNRLLLMQKHARIYNWLVLIPLLPIYAMIHVVKSVREGNGYLETINAIWNAWKDFRKGNFGKRRTY